MNNHQPEFSIIIPTYNRSYILWKTLQAFQQQNFNDWEIILIDDGSTDQTKKLVSEFQWDSRIKYFYKENAGPARARNFGLQKALGKIITYVDSDDIVYPNYLHITYQYYQKYPDKNYSLCNFNRRLELQDQDYKVINFKNDSSAQKMEISVHDIFNWEFNPCSTGISHRKSLIEKIHWDEEMPVLEDQEFLMQLAHLNPESFIHINYALYEYRQKFGQTDSMAANCHYRDYEISFQMIYDKYKDSPLMQRPEVYLSRVEKYKKWQVDLKNGTRLPQEQRYFPENYL